MKKHLISEDLEKYFSILSDENPDFLLEYTDNEEMQRLDNISTTCGICYSDLSRKEWFSTLDHSIATARIVWNFTHDKIQTLASLFHDIATPAFKHSIDYLYNDFKKQETTEDLTSSIIKSSTKIMKELSRDGIDLSDIDNYHIYPIADNDIPKLSADRLEYTLSNALGVNMKLATLDDIKEIYDDIIVLENEDGEPELGFKNLNISEKFISIMSKLSKNYNSPVANLSMKFLSDVVKTMIEDGELSESDLFKLNDFEMIEKIIGYDKHNVSKAFEIWQKSKEVYESDYPLIDRYSVNIAPKIRYIDPLVMNKGRTSKVSASACYDIEDAKNNKTKKYVYSNFNF